MDEHEERWQEKSPGAGRKREKKMMQKKRHAWIEKLVRRNIRDLVPYRSARDEAQTGLLLDANENSFGSVVSQQTAFSEASLPLHRYPDPSQKALREALSSFLGVRREEIFAGVGSDEAIDLLLRVFCEPGQEKVVILEPTYGMYEVAARINNLEVATCLLDDAFQIDLGQVKRHLSSGAKMIFCCSPNNPTGNLLDPSALLELCRIFHGIVVVDEAYIDFSCSDSLIRWIHDLPNLVILRTFSKAWGLASVRLGLAIAQEQVISYLFKIKAPYNLNLLTSCVALEALKAQGKMREMVREIVKERERLSHELMKIPGVERVFPSEANFVLIRCRGGTEVQRRLAEQGIVVRDRSTQPKLKDCLRITVGTPEQNDFLLQALQEVMSPGARETSQEEHE